MQHLKVTIDLYTTEHTPQEAVVQLAGAMIEQSEWLEPGPSIADWHIKLRSINARIHFEPVQGERSGEATDELDLFARDYSQECPGEDNFPASAPVNVEEYDPDNQRRNRLQSFFPDRTCKR